MDKPVATHDFLALLNRSELLSEKDFAKVASRYQAEEISPRELAKTLVNEGTLTRFQAERLLDGRYRGFFIDRYQLLEVLGVGGMGYVYIARDSSTDEKVALKVLTDVNEVDPGMFARLQLEARAGMLLDHPNIVKTKRIEEAGAKCFVEMEYIRSINLHELIALTGPLKWSQACDLMQQAAKGLHHAHRAGFIHRDVKPANFLIDAEGRLKVLDFGLALAKDRPEDEFSLAMIFGHECLGTADFIAPEQIENSMTVDARSDIYSLGCTFYTALTGKIPFPYPKNAQKLEAQKREQPRPILELQPEVPPEVAAIVEKMMAKKPEDRFQSAAEVARALMPWSKRKSMQFSMRDILTIRADQARKKQRSRTSNRTSEVTSGSAWTSSNARLSGTLGPQSIETAVARDTLPMTAPAPDASQPLKIMPLESTAELAASAREQFESLAVDGAFQLVSNNDGRAIPLELQQLVVGRNAECDIRLNLPGISGRHCELTFDGSCWHVRDLESKNGTQVDGSDIATATLLPGSSLTLARRYTFRLTDSNTSISATKHRLSRAMIFTVGGVVLAAVAGTIFWLMSR